MSQCVSVTESIDDDDDDERSKSIMISDVMVFQFASMRNGVWQCGKDLPAFFIFCTKLGKYQTISNFLSETPGHSTLVIGFTFYASK